MDIGKFFREYPWVVILFFAALFRFWGIWHGSPFSYYPDEQHFVNRAVAMGSGDLNPHWFHKPAFFMYILLIEYAIFYILGYLTGFFAGTDAFALYYFKSAWPFIMIGRVTVTLFGLATVYMVYKTGKDFWSKKAGIFGALILSLTYGHIFSGQDVKADIPTTFFTVMSGYYLLRAGRSFAAKDYIICGIFAGLGTATKYYSIILLPSIFLLTLYELIKKRDMEPLAKYFYAFTAFWAAYFVAAPYNFLDPLGRRGTFYEIAKLYNMISPVKYEFFPALPGSVQDHYEKHYLFESLINYLGVLFSVQGAGIVIGFFFMSALIYFIIRPSLDKILLLSVPVLFSVVSIVVNPSYTEPRHQVIIYPFLAAAAGIFIYELFERNIQHNIKFQAAFYMLLFFPLLSVISNNLEMVKPDTRNLAREWITANIPAGSKVIVDEDSAVLLNSIENLQTLYNRAKDIEKGQFTTHLDKFYYYKMNIPSSEPRYNLKEIRHIWWRDREIKAGEANPATDFDKDMANPVKTVGVNDYKYYVENGYNVLVTNDNRYNRYLENGSTFSVNFPSYRKFYENVMSHATIVKEFTPGNSNAQGPVVRIYKLNPAMG